MLEVLRFIFSDVWHFLIAGFVLLSITVLVGGIGE